ncbi:MAG TPA: hypothetical protein VN950_13230 [Terriglobales bacterium]|nr:hypothetical protein [Terriglobales bacterium]
MVSQKARQIAPKVELIYWGESFLLNELATPKLLGRRLFFFGELELSAQWCRNQVEGQLEAIGNKYIPGLHTKTIVDEAISDALGDNAAQLRIKATNNELRKATDTLKKALAELENIKEKWPESYESSKGCTNSCLSIVESVLTVGELFYGLLANADIHRGQSLPLPPNTGALADALKSLSLADLNAALDQAREQKNEETTRRLHDDYRIANRPAQIAEQNWRNISEQITIIERFRSSTLNVLGSAGYGKTHMCCAVADDRIRHELLSLLLRGIRFTREKSIKQQILSLLDIPITYSWEDFLSALNAMATVYRRVFA